MDFASPAFLCRRPDAHRLDIRAAYTHVWRRPGCFRLADRKEVARLREFLKWLHRFRFRVKLEFEAGFNWDQDR